MARTPLAPFTRYHLVSKKGVSEVSRLRALLWIVYMRTMGLLSFFTDFHGVLDGLDDHYSALKKLGRTNKYVSDGVYVYESLKNGRSLQKLEKAPEGEPVAELKASTPHSYDVFHGLQTPCNTVVLCFVSEESSSKAHLETIMQNEKLSPMLEGKGSLVVFTNCDKGSVASDLGLHGLPFFDDSWEWLASLYKFGWSLDLLHLVKESGGCYAKGLQREKVKHPKRKQLEKALDSEPKPEGDKGVNKDGHFRKALAGQVKSVLS